MKYKKAALTTLLATTLALSGCTSDNDDTSKTPAGKTQATQIKQLDVSRLGIGWVKQDNATRTGVFLCNAPFFNDADKTTRQKFTAPTGETVTVSYLTYTKTDPVKALQDRVTECSTQTPTEVLQVTSETLSTDPVTAYSTTALNDTLTSVNVYGIVDTPVDNVYAVVALEGDGSVDVLNSWGVVDAVLDAVTDAQAGKPYGPVGGVGMEPIPEAVEPAGEQTENNPPIGEGYEDPVTPELQP